MTILNILIGLVFLGAAVFIVWRLFSQRHKLPCPTWLGWMVDMDNPFTEANRTPVILGHLQLEPGMQVLDAGCGPGRLTLPLAEAVGPQGVVLALDMQAGMLARVQEKTTAAGLENVCLLQTELGDGRLPQNSCDRALLVTVLGEIPDQLPALKEIFAALKPGGILSVTEIIFDPHFQGRKKVLELAGQAGFVEKGFFGKPLAYTLHLEKPVG